MVKGGWTLCCPRPWSSWSQFDVHTLPVPSELLLSPHFLEPRKYLAHPPSLQGPPLPPASSFSLDHLPPPPNPTGRPERGTDYLGGSHCPGGSVGLLSPPAPLLCPGLALADQGFSTPLGLRGPLGPRVGILHLQKEMTFIIFVFQIEKGTNACFIF